jgi:hypothetical protein
VSPNKFATETFEQNIPMQGSQWKTRIGDLKVRAMADFFPATKIGEDSKLLENGNARLVLEAKGSFDLNFMGFSAPIGEAQKTGIAVFEGEVAAGFQIGRLVSITAGIGGNSGDVVRRNSDGKLAAYNNSYYLASLVFDINDSMSARADVRFKDDYSIKSEDSPSMTQSLLSTGKFTFNWDF